MKTEVIKTRNNSVRQMFKLLIFVFVLAQQILKYSPTF